MRRHRRCGERIMLCCLAIALLWLIAWRAPAAAEPFVAYSLKEAQRRVMKGGAPIAEVANLGGINLIAGMVYDEARRDLIIVGQRVAGYPSITLDDLVIALRALLVHKTAPLVSIDPTEQTPKTGEQIVRFEGGIGQTQYGKDLLLGDILLKKISLELESSRLAQVKSYLRLCVQDFTERSTDNALTIGSRFWFYPEATFVERQGVFAIRELRIRVRTEIIHAETNGQAVQDLRNFHDTNGDAFARSIDEHFDELALQHPTLVRLRALISLVAVAQGVGSLATTPDLRYWLQEYPVKPVETLKQYNFHVQTSQYTDKRGRASQVEVSGGIVLKALIMRLQAGEVEALREAVVKSRPDAQAVSWSVPIASWSIPWARQFLAEDSPTKPVTSPKHDKLGFYVTMRSSMVDSPSAESLTSVRKGFATPPPPPPPPPPLRVSPPAFSPATSLPWQGNGRIGGVMLSSTARVEGLNGNGTTAAAIDPTTGSFSLISQGQQMRLTDMDVRKFVTVLWAVYLGDEDPGISIDPISPESDVQLVRFIGNIVDTALAKVLLDADYFMKRAAIGAVRPPIVGFRSVDQWIGKHGVKHLGVGRRFWFVPQDIRFRKAGDALFFEGGRMTLMTEKLFRSIRGESDAGDQAFAKFWTDHYWEFAAANPVYVELFEYAKMVALAKYLKESGVSLQWCLLANRHLVLKEKNPGSVPALRAPSNVLRGVHWVGGVNLGINMSNREPGRYVVDAAAAAALRQAYARQGAPEVGDRTDSGGRASRLSGEPITARLQTGAHTIVPAKSLSGGTASRGMTFHTDIALRANGEPGVELVRYNAPGWRAGHFGAGWHLYLPYGIAPADGEATKGTEVAVQDDEGKTVKLDIMVPRHMQVVDLLDGSRETLVFDAKRFGTAAWVPRDDNQSRFDGMALLTDGSFLLFEKRGTRFRFDARARLTDMIFSPKHAMHFTYDGQRVISVEDTFGGKVELQYDSAGRVARARSATGDVHYQYFGEELASVRTLAGQKLSMIYNTDGRLDEVVVQGAHR